MSITLTNSQLADARAALLSDESDGLIELMYRISLDLPLKNTPVPTTQAAVRLGWVDIRHGHLHPTPLGALVADPLREYRFWLDRDRRLHGERDYDLLRPERYAGLSVLEPGSGFGCNLLSLSRLEGRFVGVEPVELYRQLTPVFAEREGLRTPEVVGGTGESLPFADGEFDIVMCYSAHQYMDVVPALREMARVLRPGGQMQVIGGTLDVAACILAANLVRHPSPGHLKSFLLTLGNTLSYEYRQRRLYVPGGAAATTAPIYPRLAHMRRWFREAGLQFRDDLTRRVGVETCFVADKPA